MKGKHMGPWKRAFLLPAVLSIALCCAVTWAGAHLQGKARREASAYAANVAYTFVDAAIQSARTLALEATLQPSIIQLMNRDKPTPYDLQYAAAYITNAMIVQPYVTSVSVCKRDELALRIPEAAFIESEAMVFARAQNNRSMTPVPLRYELANGQGRNIISVAYRQEGEDSPMSVVVDIDFDKLQHAFALQYPQISQVILLSNDQDQVVFSNQHASFAQPIGQIIAQAEDEAQYRQPYNEITLRGGLSVVSLSGGGAGALFGPLMIGCLAAALLFVAYYVLTRQLRPVRDFLRYVSDLPGGEEVAERYGSFPGMMQRALRVLQAVEQAGKDNEAMVVNSLFARLFAKTPPENEGFLLKELIRCHALWHVDDWCRIAVLRADNIKSYRDNGTMDIVSFQTQTAGESIAARAGVSCETVRTDLDQVVLFFNAQRDRDAAEGLEAVLESLLPVVSEETGFSFTLGLSGAVNDMNRLHSAYVEAFLSTQYRLTLGAGRLLHPKNCAHRAELEEEKAEMLIDQMESDILARDELGYTRSLNRLLDLIWGGEYEALYRVLLSLASRLEALAAKLRCEPAREEDLAAALQLMEGRRGVQEWYLAKMRTLVDALDHIEHRGAGSCIPRAIDYIAKHHGDPALSVVRIAEQFHISPQYFSKLFNQEMGCTFPQYLSDIRLEHAYRLLSGGECLAVNDVYRQCGYSSRTYFASSFKKKYGISPSKLRYVQDVEDGTG